MAAPADSSSPSRAPAEPVVRELVAELGRAFNLSTSLGERSLGAAVEERIRSLDLGGTPAWGTDGSLTQLVRSGS